VQAARLLSLRVHGPLRREGRHVAAVLPQESRLSRDGRVSLGRLLQPGRRDPAGHGNASSRGPASRTPARRAQGVHGRAPARAVTGELGCGAPRIVKANGRRFQPYSWGRPEDPPILLLHSLASHSHWWDWTAPLLAEGRHVVAVDFRGHGGSDWADPPAYRA